MKSIAASLPFALLVLLAASPSGAAPPTVGKSCFEYGDGCYATPAEACEAVARARRADRSVENPYDRVVASEDAGDKFWCNLADKNGNETDQHYGSKRSGAPRTPTADAKPSSPEPWSRTRIAAIARKRVIVGMHATVTLKEGMAALDGLRLPAAFAQIRGDEKQVQALGNGGLAALLPEVQVRKGYQPSSGYVLKPQQQGSRTIEFVSWNSGEPVRDYNASHAEHQFYQYILGTGAWLSNIAAIQVDVYGRDVCPQCDADFKHLQQVVQQRSPTATVQIRRVD